MKIFAKEAKCEFFTFIASFLERCDNIYMSEFLNNA